MSVWIEHTEAFLPIGFSVDAAKWKDASEKAKKFETKMTLGVTANVQSLYTKPLKVIGAGAFGLVMRGQRSGMTVALKMITEKGNALFEATEEVKTLIYLQQVFGSPTCRAD